MGTCSSCEAAVATAPAPLKASGCGTAKLVLPDGDLEEFASPVKASYLLRRDPSCFICHSDDMEFDGFVSAVGAEEELQPGHLYFALPLSSLRHRLRPAELAALAAKATAALRRKGYAGFVADDREPAWGSGRDVGAVVYGRNARGRLDTIEEGRD
ncbi:uncharacterized protein LOC116253114 [Nymphaea colorata]|nr:uncharacterized protein LOC116253114 [Nymphaea colorata]